MGRTINGHSVVVEETDWSDDRLRCKRCGHVGERASRFEMTECDTEMGIEEWLKGPVARVPNESVDSTS